MDAATAWREHLAKVENVGKNDQRLPESSLEEQEMGSRSQVSLHSTDEGSSGVAPRARLLHEARALTTPDASMT